MLCVSQQVKTVPTPCTPTPSQPPLPPLLLPVHFLVCIMQDVVTQYTHTQGQEVVQIHKTNQPDPLSRLTPMAL